MSFVKTSRGAGQSPLPLDRAPAGEVTRGGDLISQEIFDLVTTETKPPEISPQRWQRLQRDLASPDAQRRGFAEKLLADTSSGTPLQNQRRAKNACCLILYTLAGLTLEQIATAFGHDKGHIVRLVESAAAAYRAKVAARDGLTPDQAPTLKTLSAARKLHHRDRDRLTKKARRFAAAIRREPETEREFFLQQLAQLLSTPIAFESRKHN